MKIVARQFSENKLSFAFLYKLQNIQENMPWQIVLLNLAVGEEA